MTLADDRPPPTDADPWLTGPEAAARVGVAASTWRGYVRLGLAPPPDDADHDRPANRRNPRWRQSTVDKFQANRVGQGTRTDLRPSSHVGRWTGLGQ